MAGTPTVHFKVTGRQPEESEVRELSAMQMPDKKPSKEEVKDATKWFAVGVLAGPVLALIGYLILSAKKLAGIGKLVFGLGGMFAGIVMVIFGFASLFKIFRSAQKKTPGKSATWFWVTSVMGDDVSDGKFGKTEYAIATMARMLPVNMPFSEKDEILWLIDFRKALADAADEAGKQIRSAASLTQSPPQVSFRVDEEKEISPGLAQVSANLTFHDMFSYSTGNNSQTNKIVAATLQIAISQYYIRNGQVWFPYDLTPAYERLDTPANE